MKYFLTSLVTATLGFSCMYSYAATTKQNCSWYASEPAKRDACYNKSKSFGSKTGSEENDKKRSVKYTIDHLESRNAAKK